jgi:hypothetical protein
MYRIGREIDTSEGDGVLVDSTQKGAETPVKGVKVKRPPTLCYTYTHTHVYTYLTVLIVWAFGSKEKPDTHIA